MPDLFKSLPNRALRLAGFPLDVSAGGEDAQVGWATPPGPPGEGPSPAAHQVVAEGGGMVDARFPGRAGVAVDLLVPERVAENG